MRFLIYEDNDVSGLTPLVHLRPAFELVCGRESLRRRIQRWLPNEDWGVQTRPSLCPTYSQQFADAHVNDSDWTQSGPLLIINGRWIPAAREDLLIHNQSNAGFVDGELAWIELQRDELPLLAAESFSESILGIARTRDAVETSGILVKRPWDLVSENRKQLIADFLDVGLSQPRNDEHVQIVGDDKDVYIDPTALIDPYVVIDSRTGPVSIERDVHIQSFTRIEGPCHIGRGSKIFRGVIRSGTTVGDNCRVGGEVEESILHACVNKYHEGFLGHSYVCPWVNIGAMSTTSDLKNDYSNVQVPMSGELLDTGLQKVGSFFGDHSKVAIDSMFNTGSVVGVMSMVLPGGKLLPRNIPSFGYVAFGELTSDLDLDGAIATARIVMNRRGCELTTAMETLLRDLHQQSEPERARAIQRAIQRRMQA